MIRCAYCGLKGLSYELKFEDSEDYGVCDDCDKFISILNAVYDTIEEAISEKEIVDFFAVPEIRMLVDFGFISQSNTHLAAYIKTISMLLEFSLTNKKEIKEIEVARKISSLKTFGEIFAPFVYLDLVRIEFDSDQNFDRLIFITEKFLKFSKPLLIDSDPSEASLADQIQKRTALCLLGYVLLGLMKMHSETVDFPSNFKLRSLWSTFSYIWPSAWSKRVSFDEKEFESHVKKRGVTNASVGKILQAFRQLNPNQLNTLFDAIDARDDQRIYIFNKEFLTTVFMIKERSERERAERERTIS